MTTSKTTTQIAVTNGRLLLLMTLDPKEIGSRIAAARDERGWTQFELAKQANVSLSTVTRWEAGKLPPVRELKRVAGVLGVEANYLVESAADAEDASPSDFARLERQVEELQGRLTDLHAYLREKLG